MQIHSRNKHARTPHRLQVKLRLWEAQLANGQHFPRLAACVPDDVELDTCISVAASLRGNLPPVLKESGRWLRTSGCLPPHLTFPWTTPLPPVDGVGGATVQ